MTDEPPGPPDRLAGRGLDARHRAPRPRTRTPASPRPPPRTRPSPPSGRTPRACPISAILFGGRRASVVPLVTQSFDWEHGVFLGSIMASETTAAAAGAVGNLRRDPFAMLPFCGYNMADYFAHWLRIGAAATDRDAPAEDLLRQLVPQGRRRQVPVARLRRELPRARVGLRARRGRGEAVETPIGSCPRPGAIDTEGLDVSKEDMVELLRVDTTMARRGPAHPGALRQFGDHLPPALADQVDGLEGGERLREGRGPPR